MERMSFIGSSYYRGAHAALLCYNSNNKETFTILSQYILDIVMNAEGAKIFLCGNMADGEGKEKVGENDLDVFMSECEDVLSGVYTVSCKDNWGLQEMFEDMAKVLHTDAINRMTIRRDLIRPGETPELDEETQGKKRCCWEWVDSVHLFVCEQEQKCVELCVVCIDFFLSSSEKDSKNLIGMHETLVNAEKNVWNET